MTTLTAARLRRGADSLWDGTARSDESGGEEFMCFAVYPMGGTMPDRRPFYRLLEEHAVSPRGDLTFTCADGTVIEDFSDGPTEFVQGARFDFLNLLACEMEGQPS